MPYVDKYPKADAHGRPIDRVVLISVLTGQEEIALDDGFDVVDGDVIPHIQCSLLKARLEKRVKAPNGDLVPAFVVKEGHKFRSGARGERHPLARYEQSARGVDVAGISAEVNAKREKEAEQVKARSEEMARPFVEAAKKASKQ